MGVNYKPYFRFNYFISHFLCSLSVLFSLSEYINPSSPPFLPSSLLDKPPYVSEDQLWKFSESAVYDYMRISHRQGSPQKKENAKYYFRNEILFHASAPVSLREPREQMPDGGVSPVRTPHSEIFIRFWHSPIGGETKGALCPVHLVLYTNLSFDVELFQLFISSLNH